MGTLQFSKLKMKETEIEEIITCQVCLEFYRKFYYCFTEIPIFLVRGSICIKIAKTSCNATMPTHILLRMSCQIMHLRVSDKYRAVSYIIDQQSINTRNQ